MHVHARCGCQFYQTRPKNIHQAFIPVKMIIYKDRVSGESFEPFTLEVRYCTSQKLFLFTGDELFSDTYKMRVVDEIFYEVEGKVSMNCC